MSRTLARGYGKQIVHNKEEFLAVGNNWRSLLDSEPERIVYFDSDMNYYLEAIKIANSAGQHILEYQTRKLTYKQFLDSEQDFNQSLFNGYDIPEIFEDKSQLYNIGPVLPLRFLTVVIDSEGASTWKKIDEPGIDKGDYEVKKQLLGEPTQLKEGKSFTGFKNQINLQNFDMEDFVGQVVVINAENFVVDSDRFVFSDEFQGGDTGRQSGVVQITDEGRDVEAIQFLNLIEQDSEEAYVDSDIKFHYGVVSRDSDNIGFVLDNTVGSRRLKFRYLQPGYDSEIYIQDFTHKDFVPVTFPRELYLADSDSFVTSFTTWHGDEEPWNVFNDSDNDGFKAPLGVQSGYIGLITDDPLYRYKLDRLIIENKPAT